MRLFLMLIIFFVATACVSAAKVALREPQSLPYALSKEKIDSLWLEDPSFSDLIGILKRERAPSKIAAYLEEVRGFYPQYLDSYTLMYNSLSLQESSFQYPRAIVFGTTARVILTFNGDPKQRGYSAIESMEYDLNKGFLFREIAFLDEGGSMAPEDIDPQLSTSKVLVSKANPHKCQQCHGFTNTRPIWENYPLWPGAYGSDDDNLYRWRSDTKRPSVVRIAELVGEDVEMTEIKKFIEGPKKTNARYKALGNFITQVLDPKAALSRGISATSYYGAEARPNLSLQMHLYEMAAREQVRSLSGNPNFLKWRLAIASGVNSHRNFAFYLPENLRSDASRFEIDEKNIDSWLLGSMVYHYEQATLFDQDQKGHTDIKKPYIKSDDLKSLLDLRKSIRSSPKHFGVGTMEGDEEEKRVQFILTNLGHDASEWSINFKRTPYNRNGDTRKPFVIQSILYFAELFPDEDWTSMQAISNSSTYQNAELEERSRKLLSQ